jgi:hypothetical protein
MIKMFRPSEKYPTRDTIPLTEETIITTYLVILPGPLRAALRQLGVGLKGGVVDPNKKEPLARTSKLKI